MPYRDRDVRRAYQRLKSREHYVAHRQQAITRARDRKRWLRKLGKEWNAMTSHKCPKCGGRMTKEEVGGRRYWDCEKADCSGRILLDERRRDAAPSDASLVALARPKLTLPTVLTMDEPRRGHTADARSPAKPYGNGKMPSLPEDVRRRIGEGVRKAAEERRRLKASGHETSADARIRVSPNPTPTIGTSRTLGMAAVNPLTAIMQALEALEAEEHRLHDQLIANQAGQGALKQAASILREVAS